MHPYCVGDVERLLRLPRSTLKALIAAGYVSPARGPRNALRFSFQDLIVLRTAQALAAANIPAQRINRSLKALRRQLPDSMPLSGLSIRAVGKDVVVRDGTGQRQAESGQYLLAFDGDPESGALNVVEKPRPAVAAPRASDDWYEQGIRLEDSDPAAAIRAYEQAIRTEPRRMDARINLGRMLHDRGQLARAERVYRDAIAEDGEDALVHFNLAVLLEDSRRPGDALSEYQAALHCNPRLADAHYNLALLYEKLKKPREALRHMAQYRRLTAKRID